MVKDIAPLARGTPASVPLDGVPFAGQVFFSANLAMGPGRSQRALCRTDGTATGTVVVPTPGAVVTGGLTAVGSTLFFVAATTTAGSELWAYDLSRGARLVRDIRPGATGSGIVNLTTVGNVLFFACDDGTHGGELWRSDGTEAGTILVRDIHPGSSHPNWLTDVAGTLYFAADDGVAGNELWKTDGTAAGTVLVADLVVGSGSSQPRHLTALGTRLVFSTDDGTQRELWRSDGTAATTQRVVDLNGTGSGDPAGLVASGGFVWFQATTQAEGRELWRSDGTVTGTRIVTDLTPGAASTPLEFLRAYRGGVVFSAWQLATGNEPYFSDGTSTVFIADLWPGSAGSFVEPLLEHAGDIWLRFYRGDIGWSLCRSNGTAGNVTVIAHGGRVTPLAPLSNHLLFGLDDGVVGLEPWITDGTPGGTRLLVDLYAPEPISAEPNSLIELDGSLLLQANDGQTGPEMWRSDGTAAGTRLVADLVAGFDIAFHSPVRIGHRVFFAAPARDGSEPFRLWVTDGTSAATRDLGPIPSAPFPPRLHAAEQGVFAIAVGLGTTGLSFSDGTSAPASLGRFTNFSPASTIFRGALWFAADDGVHGTELWRSDGTATGTRLVADLAPGSAGSHAVAIAGAGDRVFFTANDGVHGYELWSTDGTNVVLHEIAPGASSAAPGGFVAVGNAVYFSAAADPTSGFELWRADGSAAGTVMILDLEPNGSSQPAGLTLAGDRVFFTAYTAATGRELWSTDGTAAGTRLIADIWPGPQSSFVGPNRLAPLGSASRLAFAANDGVHGEELWTSDGTAAGTRLFVDVNPGPADSEPMAFAQAGARLFFAAHTNAHGRELHAFHLAAAAAPLAAAYGAGCVGSAGIPSHTAIGLPTLGATFTFALTRARRDAPAGFLIAAQRAYLPVPGGCEVLVSPTGITVAAQTDSAGAAALALSLPNDRQLIGLETFSQFLVLDPAGAYAALLSASNGLHVVVGD